MSVKLCRLYLASRVFFEWAECANEPVPVPIRTIIGTGTGSFYRFI